MLPQQSHFHVRHIFTGWDYAEWTAAVVTLNSKQVQAEEANDQVIFSYHFKV